MHVYAPGGGMGDDEGIGAKLRVAREAAGMSLSAMAARTHYTRGHLSNVETGKRPAAPDVVLAYVRVLGDDMERRDLLAGLAAKPFRRSSAVAAGAG